MLWLFLIALGAIVIRLIPTLTNYGWGNDFGIYYSITEDYVKAHLTVINVPSQWGAAGYGSFPVMYWIISAAYYITGISWKILLTTIPEIFGGLTVVSIFFITKEITRNEKISLIAALFLAVNPIQAYQTSIPSILVFGHFFGLLTVLMLIITLRNKKAFVPLAVFSVLLVLSHQLSTFMYLFEILGILLYLKISRSRLDKSYYFYLASFSTFMFAYWIINVKATTSFMTSGIMNVPWYVIILSYYILITVMFFLPSKMTAILRKAAEKLKPISSKYIIRATMLLSFVVPIIGVIVFRKYIDNLSIYAIGVFIPTFIITSIASIGYIYAWNKYRIVLGMLSLLLAAAIFSIATMNSVLLPGRFFEYLFEIVSIFDGIGVYEYINEKRPHTIRIEYKRRASDTRTFTTPTPPVGNISQSIPCVHIDQGVASSRISRNEYFERKEYTRAQTGVAILLLIVLVGSAFSIYPIGSIVVPSGTQSISYQDEAAIQWLDVHGNRSFSVASDHRLGLLVEAYNFTDTFEYSSYLWNKSSYTLYEPQLTGAYENKTLPPVGYVLIDNYMYKDGVWGYGGVTNPDSPSLEFTNSSFLKFFMNPFVPVYFNYSYSTNDWAMIVEVNWTYIDSVTANVSVHMALNQSLSYNDINMITEINSQLIPQYSIMERSS